MEREYTYDVSETNPRVADHIEVICESTGHTHQNAIDLIREILNRGNGYICLRRRSDGSGKMVRLALV